MLRVNFVPVEGALLFVLLLLIAFSITPGCSKEALPPEVITLDPRDVGSTSAWTGGIVVEDHGVKVEARGVCWSVEGIPVIGDFHMMAGAGTGEFELVLDQLMPDNRYFLRAWALSDAGIGYGNTMVIYTTKLYDVNGNAYQTMKIGKQLWMSENLIASHLNDGTPLRHGTALQPAGMNAGYYYYNDDSASHHTLYGKLYNWYAVETGKLCPEGWQVPSNDDWYELNSWLGGAAYSGGELKEQDTLTWAPPNTAATNSTGFNARPGGIFVAEQTTYSEIRQHAYYWAKDGYVSNNAWCQHMAYNAASNLRHFHPRQRGLSVRCLKTK